ncbi:hypothetical protein Bca4012_009237 [Brassica carinata]
MFVLTIRKAKASFGKGISGCCCSKASPFAYSNHLKKIPPAQALSNLEEEWFQGKASFREDCVMP